MKLAAEVPTSSDHRNEAARSIVNLARVRAQEGKHAEAHLLLAEAEPYHRAAMRANPRHPDYRENFRYNRSGLARALLALGDHAGVPPVVAELLEYTATPATDTYDAACFLARCVSLAEHDARLFGPARYLLAQQYADKAMTYLARAVQLGFRDSGHIRKDPDLNPLRERPDLRQLLADLEAAARPPKVAPPPRPAE